jgi:hypothetical protein
MPKNKKDFSQFDGKEVRSKKLSNYCYNIDARVDEILVKKFDNLKQNLTLTYNDMDFKNEVNKDLVLFLDPNHYLLSFFEYLLDNENQDEIVDYVRGFITQRKHDQYATAPISCLENLKIQTNFDLYDSDFRQAAALSLKTCTDSFLKILTTDYINKSLLVGAWNTQNISRIILASQAIAILGLNKSLFEDTSRTIDYSVNSKIRKLCRLITPMLIQLYVSSSDFDSDIARVERIFNYLSKTNRHPLVELLIRIVVGIQSLFFNFFAINEFKINDKEKSIPEVINNSFIEYMEFMFDLSDANITRFELNDPTFILSEHALENKGDNNEI